MRSLIGGGGGGVLVTAGGVLKLQQRTVGHELWFLTASRRVLLGSRPWQIPIPRYPPPLHRSAASENAGMRRVTAPRVISAAGTGGKRSRDIYCVQLALAKQRQGDG